MWLPNSKTCDPPLSPSEYGTKSSSGVLKLVTLLARHSQFSRPDWYRHLNSTFMPLSVEWLWTNLPLGSHEKAAFWQNTVKPNYTHFIQETLHLWAFPLAFGPPLGCFMRLITTWLWHSSCGQFVCFMTGRWDIVAIWPKIPITPTGIYGVCGVVLFSLQLGGLSFASVWTNLCGMSWLQLLHNSWGWCPSPGECLQGHSISFIQGFQVIFFLITKMCFCTVFPSSLRHRFCVRGGFKTCKTPRYLLRKISHRMCMLTHRD